MAVRGGGGREPITATLSLRVDLDPGGRIGPGKIELLEKIAALGSISAAGRAMDMSYRRAWTLVEEINAIFGKPAVASQAGGRRGGGAKLTGLGLALVTRFRAVERAAAKAAAEHLAALQVEVERPVPPDPEDEAVG
jgi:molybdate transport system regulatory protein